MLVKDIILELYDPEGKYTGNKPPNTPPPRGRGGPDWEGDDDSLWREFFQLMREKLIELNFKILYPRQASDTELLLDASWPQTKTDDTSGVMRVKFNLDSGDTTATIHVLAYKNIISTSEPWQNRRFRIRITDFDWALRKISTIQAVLKQTRPTTEDISLEKHIKIK